MAGECNDLLEPFGKTIRHATDHYVTFLRASAKSCTISELAEQMQSAKKADGVSTSHFHDLKSRLKKFCADFGDQNAATVSTREVDDWLRRLDLAPQGRNNYRSALRSLFNFAIKRSYATANPAANTEKAKVVNGPPGILTIAQTVSLLNACESDTLPFVAISLFAGLRAAEMEKLDWSEVDLEGGHVEVTASKAKTARRRLIPIAENLAAWIQPHAAQTGSVAPVGLRKRFDAVKARAGLADWPPNAMRHSFASYRLAQCQDAARVSLEMGNSPAMVFAHYRELVKERDAARYWKIMPGADTKKVIAFTGK
jgi:integrase